VRDVLKVVLYSFFFFFFGGGGLFRCKDGEKEREIEEKRVGSVVIY
jgi:hypothetical protein